MNINKMVEEAHNNSRNKGFWDDAACPYCGGDGSIAVGYKDMRLVSEPCKQCDGTGLLVGPHVLTKLMLVVTELAEAAEDYRDGRDLRQCHYEYGADKVTVPVDKPRKPCGFPSELADVIIRVADLAGALGIDLETVITEKFAYNRSRSRMHGGKKA